MNIYYGKNKVQAKKITLKNLLMKTFKIKDPKITINSNRFSDDSTSWLEIQKETDNINKNGGRVDVVICFDTETDNSIVEYNMYVSEKLTGYDEENMKKLK